MSRDSIDKCGVFREKARQIDSLVTRLFKRNEYLRAIEYIVELASKKPLEAIDCLLSYIDEKPSKKLLDIISKTLLHALTSIDKEVINRYLNGITRGYGHRIRVLLLRDLRVLLESISREEIASLIASDLREGEPLVLLHLRKVLSEKKPVDILNTVASRVPSRVYTVATTTSDLGSSVNCLTWISEKGIVATGTSSGELVLVNRDGTVSSRLDMCRGVATSLSWSSSNGLLAIACGWKARDTDSKYFRGSIILYDLDNRERMWIEGRKDPFRYEEPYAIEWDPSGEILAIVTRYYYLDEANGSEVLRGRLLLYDIGKGKLIETRYSNAYLNDLSWSSDGRLIAVVGNYKVINIYGVDGSVVHRIDVPREYGEKVYGISWSPSSELIAFYTENSVCLADPLREDILWCKRLGVKPDYTENILWSSDGEYIIVGLRGKIIFYNRDGSIAYVSQSLRGSIRGLCLADNDQLLIAGLSSRVAILRDYIDWDSVCLDTTDIVLRRLCSGCYRKALGYYLLLGDLGLEVLGEAKYGLLGLSSTRVRELFSKLADWVREKYLRLIWNNMYSIEKSMDVSVASKYCERIIENLYLLDRITSKISNHPGAKELVDLLSSDWEEKSLVDALGFLESIVSRLIGKNVYGEISVYEKTLDSISLCINRLSEYSSLYDDLRYCLDLINRKPSITASIDNKSLTHNVWEKIIVRITNKERIPVIVEDVIFPKEYFQVGKVSSRIVCKPGSECTLVAYVKPIDRGFLSFDLLLEVSTVTRTRLSLPLEIVVKEPGIPVVYRRGFRVFTSGEAYYEVSSVLPSTSELYSVGVYGFKPLDLSGATCCRVYWGKTYVYGIDYDGFIECKRIGCGGWGCCYYCRAGDLEFVVKIPIDYRYVFEESNRQVIPPTIKPSLYNRIREVAETIASLQHPGVIGILGYGRRLPALVYEYANQGSLDYQLSCGWRPSFRDVLVIGLQVCDALRYIHSRGLVHRDIKPSNVLANNGVVKLGDFSSLTRLLARTSRYSKITGCTPGYCAPEQLYRDLRVEARKRGVENRVDVYQVANLLLELLGIDTINGDEIDDVDLDTHLEPIEDSELRELLKQMLQPEPWKRPSIEEVEKALYKIYSSLKE